MLPGMKLCGCCGFTVTAFDYDELYGCCSDCAWCYSLHDPQPDYDGSICHHGACRKEPLSLESKP